MFTTDTFRTDRPANGENEPLLRSVRQPGYLHVVNFTRDLPGSPLKSGGAGLPQGELHLPPIVRYDQVEVEGEQRVVLRHKHSRDVRRRMEEECVRPSSSWLRTWLEVWRLK